MRLSDGTFVFVGSRSLQSVRVIERSEVCDIVWYGVDRTLALVSVICADFVAFSTVGTTDFVFVAGFGSHSLPFMMSGVSVSGGPTSRMTICPSDPAMYSTIWTTPLELLGPSASWTPAGPLRTTVFVSRSEAPPLRNL